MISCTHVSFSKHYINSAKVVACLMYHFHCALMVGRYVSHHQNLNSIWAQWCNEVYRFSVSAFFTASVNEDIKTSQIFMTVQYRQSNTGVYDLLKLRHMWKMVVYWQWNICWWVDLLSSYGHTPKSILLLVMNYLNTRGCFTPTTNKLIHFVGSNWWLN